MKKMELMSKLVLALIAIVVVFSTMTVSIVAQSAVAANSQVVRCGDTITQSIKLVADIGPCQGAGIHIGADNITLNCNGHAVRGGGSRTLEGISNGYTSQGITIKNCQVTEFSNGFILRGSYHTVQNNIATNNRVDGFIFSGISNSKLQGNIATNNKVSGFTSADAHNNKMQGNSATHNGRVGFILYDSSHDNNLQGNAASYNGVGFSLYDSRHNSLLGNDAENNVGAGFIIDGDNGSEDNNLRNNKATNNGGDGFIIEFLSIHNSLIQNKAENNVGFGYNEVASGGLYPVYNTYIHESCKGNDAGGSNPTGLCKPQS
jgi:parallel beta-helix repeat protein